MSESAILTAARAAVAAALPGGKDWSDDPANIRPDKLDAFAVTVTRDGAVPAAMGSAQEEVQLTIGVEVFTEYGPAQNGRALASVKGEAIRAALRSDPALAAAIDFITGAAMDVDLAKGERRLARATVEMSVLATF
ncbi:minor tail protein [Rhodobacter phage RcSaxon]|uniref:Minor tail protein n=1 Tax=Rhodobacter phage RcSaxon TaxID=1698423 RepID=A0A0K1Y6I5_9CAUD|nr:minor tail protein [Rhodobacter phage RcSaxon]